MVSNNVYGLQHQEPIINKIKSPGNQLLATELVKKLLKAYCYR